MPQPKAKTTDGSRRSRAAQAVDPTGLLEILARGVVLTADRIQEAMDDAVRRGRMTRGDAEDLARLLIEAGRKQSEELVRDVEQLVGRPLAVAGDARRRAGERFTRESDRAKRAAGRGAFPIADYDDLTAAQITTRVADLSDADLRAVRDYERRHGNRKSVLRAVERRLPQ